MQGEKTEAWLVSPASREYFTVESQLFCMPTNSQKIYSLVRWTAKYVFFIREAIKIAVIKIAFVLCCSCEITQNMVFQLLKNFKVEINFG